MNPDIREWVAEHNPEALLADGMEAAFLGMGERCGQPTIAVYDVEKCIQALVDGCEMNWDEAVEYFEFNTLRAWVGEHTPLFLWRYPFENRSE